MNLVQLLIIAVVILAILLIAALIVIICLVNKLKRTGSQLRWYNMSSAYSGHDSF